MTDDNMAIWKAVARVPEEHLKQIRGGRLNGKSSIDPTWRIMELTRQFGPCGFGWRYEISSYWLDSCNNSVEIVCSVELSLFVKHGEEWSAAIPGIGSHKMAIEERNGLHINDEAYKMALTDALSVACKALGVGADVYLGIFDGDKYLRPSMADQEASNRAQAEAEKAKAECAALADKLIAAGADKDEMRAVWKQHADPVARRDHMAEWLDHVEHSQTGDVHAGQEVNQSGS